MRPRPASPRTYTELVAFDVARAAAALAVLLAHGRSFLLLDLKDQPALSWFGRFFYAVSALGHQAVIVFFVVSGALVTRSMMVLEASGHWSWQTYASARLTRLWTVLFPCLLLGGCLDTLGMRFGDQLVYAGHYGALRTSAPAVPIRLDPLALAGNLAFLQTIAVPPYGTNVPLWSLANEAWYYVCAFLAWSIVRERSQPLRAVACLAGFALAFAFVLTPDMRALAPAWVVGAFLALRLPAPGRWAGQTAPHARSVSLARICALSLLAITIAVARANAVQHQLAGDYAVAGSAALCLLAYRNWHPRLSSGIWITRRIAQLSYSLYLSHFPLLALIAALGLANRRMPLGPQSLLVLTATLIAAVTYAVVLWWCFERHTLRVRRRATNWLERRGRAAHDRIAGQEGLAR